MTVTIDISCYKSRSYSWVLGDFVAAADVSGKELVINGTKIDFSGMTAATA